MSDLYRLVYTSRNHLEDGEDEQNASVAGILALSKRNNARVGVTGALLFNAGSFAQVLEGPRAAVEATFERIQRDPRHSDVSVLQCEPVTARGFPNWSMAFIGQSPRGRALWDEVARRTDFDMGRMEGDRLFATLLAIVQEEEENGKAERPQPFEPVSKGFDVEEVRRALQPNLPEKRPAADPDGGLATPQPPHREAGLPSMPPVQAPAIAGPAADVLRTALEEERARTTALRRELDDMRIDLAAARSEVREIGRHRDIWAERAKAMAAVIVREPEDRPEAHPAAQGSRIAIVR